jgi:hypothetical protein
VNPCVQTLSETSSKCGVGPSRAGETRSACALERTLPVCGSGYVGQFSLFLFGSGTAKILQSPSVHKDLETSLLQPTDSSPKGLGEGQVADLWEENTGISQPKSTGCRGGNELWAIFKPLITLIFYSV